jgi:TolB protein
MARNPIHQRDRHASPECKHIVLSGVIDNTWDILVVDPVQRQFLNLTRSTADEHDPAISPDGNRIAFSARYNNNWDIYILTLSDGSIERFTNHPAYDGFPSWSPDGSQIVFESHRNNDLDLFLASVNSNEVRTVTDSPQADIEPIWLPNGEEIIFGSWRSGKRQLYHLDLETQKIEALTEPDEEARQPALSSNGRYLAYVAMSNTTAQLKIRDMKGGETTIVSMRHTEWPFWSSVHHEHMALHESELMTLRLTGGGAYAYPAGWSLVSYPAAGATIDDSMVTPEYHLTLPGLQWQRMSCTSLESLHNVDSWLPLSHMTHELPLTSQEGLTTLQHVEALQPQLSADVVHSYQRLRQQTLDASGYDFLGELYDAWRGLDHPDNTFMSWHTAGRAIDVYDWYQQSGDRILYTARQNMGGQTYFRIFLRTAQQDGSQGKPLRESLWETDRGLAGSQSFNSEMRQIAPIDGYFVDFTDLAEREGWTRIPALTPPDGDWTTNYLGLEFWHYERRDQMTWYTAMQRIFSTAQLEKRFMPDQVLSHGYTVPQMIRSGTPGASQLLMDGLSCHYVDKDDQSNVLCEPQLTFR